VVAARRYNVEPFWVDVVKESSRVSLARFEHPPGVKLPTTYSRHQAADRFHITVVERGCFRLRHAGREWTLGTGAIFLSRPGEEYRYSHLGHTEPDACLRLEFMQGTDDELAGALNPLPLVLPTTNRLGFLRLQLRAFIVDDVEMSLDGIACEMVEAARDRIGAERHLYRPSQLAWYAERVHAAREHMDRDPAAKHSLWELAAAVGMSPFIFARVFRELIGTPPHKYLVRLRLQRARLLLEGGMSVSRTCQSAGFNNLSHFIRTYRAHFGVLPSAVKSSRVDSNLT